MTSYKPDDAEFMTDLRAAVIRGPRIYASALLVAIVLVLGAVIYWTSQARVPLVTNGEGQVIPSSQVQVVQDLEGGIIEEIMIKEGQVVRKGDILMRKSAVQSGAKLAEERARYGTHRRVRTLNLCADHRQPHDQKACGDDRFQQHIRIAQRQP